MSTKYIASNWRLPNQENSSKNDNYGLTFDGSGEYIDCGNGIGNTIGDNYTGGMAISLWFKADTTSGSEKGLFIFEGSTAWGEITVYFYLGKIELRVEGDDKNLDYTFSDTSSFHHLLINFLGPSEDNQVYLDGAAIGSTFTYSGTGLDLNGEDLKIGYTYSSSYDFDGVISEFAVFNYSLSATQISTLYGSSSLGSGNPMALTPQPIAYYPLGDNSASNPLTQPNVAVEDASVFDSNGNSYILTKTGAEFDISTKFSFSLWANIQLFITYDHFIGASNATWGQGFGLYISSYKLQFWVDTYNGVGKYVTTDSNLSTNKWYHIACTYDDTNGGLMYIDGVAQNSGTAFTGATLDSNDLNKIIRIFGTTTGYAIDAFMSNVQIWNTELSASDVTTLYNSGVPLLTGTQPQAANLKAWYKLNNSANWEADSAGNWQIPDANSAYPQSFDFNGSSTQYVNCGTTLGDLLGASNENLTFSIWFNIDSSPNNDGLLTLSSGPSAGNTGGVAVQIQNSTNINIYWNNSAATLTYSTPTVSEWHNLTVVKEGATVTAYINGNVSSPTASSGSIPSSIDFSGLSTLIGMYWNTSYTFNGKISNLQFWDTGLDASQVETLYNNGSPLTTAIASSNLKLWAKLDNSATFSTNWSVPDASGNGNTGTSSGMTEQNLVNNNVSTLNAESTGMTSANLVTSDLTRAIPYDNYSFNFDGTDDKITLSSGISTGNNYSVSFWLNPDDVAAGNSYIFSDSTGSPWEGLALDQGSSTAGGAGNFYYYDGSVNIVNTTAIPLGSWTHIVISLDVTGQEIKFYINGGLDKTTTSVSSIGTLIDEFGTRSAGNYFNGKLSNISIFNEELTSTEVLKLYANGVPQDLSSFTPQPVAWYTLGSNSFWNGSNWICRDLIGSNDGTSANAGADALQGNAPRSEANGTGSNMDVPSNLEGNTKWSSNNSYSVNMSSLARVEDVA